MQINTAVAKNPYGKKKSLFDAKFQSSFFKYYVSKISVIIFLTNIKNEFKHTEKISKIEKVKLKLSLKGSLSECYLYN